MQSKHRVRGFGAALATLFVLTPGAPAFAEPSRSLTLEQRIDYQRRIERIRWRHRVQNVPGEHGTFETAVPEALIRTKVESYLRQGALLASFWGRPLTGAQLQAELDRMARRTTAPDRLRELHAALDHDPFVIAECLARPTLTERLIRSWYATDDRLHADVRSAARGAIAAATGSFDALRVLGDSYGETVWERDDDSLGPDDPRVQRLSGAEWEELTGWLAQLLDLPPATPGRLREEHDRFLVQAVLERSPDRIRIGAVSWIKRDFQVWWSSLTVTNVDPGIVAPVEGGYRPTQILGNGCEVDTWSPVPDSGPPGHRFNHTAVWTGSEMIVWGGSTFHHPSGNVDYLDTGARFDPATDTWTPTSTGTGNPSARGLDGSRDDRLGRRVQQRAGSGRVPGRGRVWNRSLASPLAQAS